MKTPLGAASLPPAWQKICIYRCWLMSPDCAILRQDITKTKAATNDDRYNQDDLKHCKGSKLSKIEYHLQIETDLINRMERKL